MTLPRFLDAGETALVVEFGQGIDPAVNARVLALDAALGRMAPAGMLERVPTYRSLMVHYDPLILPREGLIADVNSCLNAPPPPPKPRNHWSPPALTLPRRTSPRAQFPSGSLIIAGGQAIVATMAMPSGWHILGRTPERLFRPDRAEAFLIAVGDVLSFDPVDRAAFDALEQRAEAGETLARSVPL